MGVTIDLNAIRENKRRIEALGRPVFAVVKNNAYNLGMEPVVTTLYEEGVRHFMVTTLDEAERGPGISSGSARLRHEPGLRLGNRPS